MAKKITVIGAGIVGVCCAEHLRRAGHRVTLVDRQAPGEATSFGNAGILASGNVLPVVMPGMWKKIPSMLMDATGPLSIRWSYLPKAMPWIWAMFRNATPAKVATTMPALAALARDSAEEHRQLAAGTDAEALFRPDACYTMAYDTEAAYQAERPTWELKQKGGVRLKILRGQEIQAHDPAIPDRFAVCVLIQDTGFVGNPGGLVKRYAAHFEKEGGILLQRTVKDVEIRGGKVMGLVTDAGTLEIDNLVLAAGAWSGHLARRLGSPVPLDTERGFHVMLPNTHLPLKGPLSVVSKNVVMIPMDMGLRLCGGVEIGGLNAPANPARFKKLLKGAKEVMPNLDMTDHTEWMGYRPTLPDSLPVLGPSPNFDNVFFAFGHQHLGLTMGAKTGRIIADLLSDRQPNIDLSPYRADRF